MVELIITEKPNAAKKIAEALAEGKPVKEAVSGVPFYRISRGKKDIVVGCAVGHLYGLAEKEKKRGFSYPVFDIQWVPVGEMSKESAFSKKYLAVLEKLAKKADAFVVATDYDIEGEVIGYNIIRFACRKKDARRMKFSTLTKPDLERAYDTLSPTLDWGMAFAGETRHFLDFYYGINLSRALTRAVSQAGRFGIMSTGRVQGPALKIVVDREREISAFKPVPFWQISLNGAVKQYQVEAWHKTDKFWKKEEADAVFAKVNGEKKGTIAAVERSSFQQSPPKPFDLTTLQTESYRCFGINPKTTLSIAQDLYTGGFISYPRTSSQQLPEAIGFRTILSQLAKQKDFAKICHDVLAIKQLKPNNGSKSDPAHPAIYPTGIAPKKVDERAAKVYDLVVKRFCATFGEPAERETVVWTIDVRQELFVTKGARTVKAGWHVLYAPYVKLEEIELPAVVQGAIVDISQILLHAKETQPPKRFTPSSIIKELEKRGLGTKATRAEIVDTLAKRNYVKGEALQATELGMQIVTVLEKYCPRILDEALTRHFEEDMEKIREHAKKPELVLSEARDVLTELLADFKAKEKDIGEGLKTTLAETQQALTTVGPCPKCKQGMLQVRKGKFGKFIACNRYPDCTTTFKLPASGLVQVLPEKSCSHCAFPMVKIIRKAKRPQEVCISPDCPSKVGAGIVFVEKKCPKCGEGTVILRKSIYGSFAACNKFPKCRYIERLAEKVP
ncbi:DNA topoisomerase I [Candidatus Woesearchaeota archaeon]|nr:DNA topoisomerase I [Candidatus Woesearchaeota archaeon]